MNNETNLARLITLLNNKNAVAITLGMRPSLDSLAAGLTLYLALTKAGKQTTIAAADELTTPLPLFAAEKIQKKLTSAGSNLVVSFPYVDGAIDKVTYTIENNYFNLLIQPKEGHEKLNPSQVRYSYTGGAVDMIITIDVPSLEYLGGLYTEAPDAFKTKEIINIDRHVTNAQFGIINIVDKTASSTSEIILKILRTLGAELTPEMATNLYLGLRSATNNFTSYAITAETFENSALLLKAGAAKKPPITEVITEELLEPKPTAAEETPQDWLKPKIFKGSQLI